MAPTPLSSTITAWIESASPAWASAYLREPQHPVRRAAHVEEVLLLAAVEHDAERAGVAQQERLVGVVLLDAGALRRVHRLRAAERPAELIAHAQGVGRGHRGAVVVPD